MGEPCIDPRSPQRAFEPAHLERVREGLDLASCGLVPVNDPKQWRLFAPHRDGFRHAWQHIQTGWLSQTLTVPRWALESPESARTWLLGGVE